MQKVILPEGYTPSEDEEYMNPMQLSYFKLKWDWDILSSDKSKLLTRKSKQSVVFDNRILAKPASTLPISLFRNVEQSSHSFDNERFGCNDPANFASPGFE